MAFTIVVRPIEPLDYLILQQLGGPLSYDGIVGTEVPLFRSLTQSGLHRIEMDVQNKSLQILLSSDAPPVECPAEQCACSIVLAVECLCIAIEQVGESSAKERRQGIFQIDRCPFSDGPLPCPCRLCSAEIMRQQIVFLLDPDKKVEMIGQQAIDTGISHRRDMGEVLFEKVRVIGSGSEQLIATHRTVVHMIGTTGHQLVSVVLQSRSKIHTAAFPALSVVWEERFHTSRY